MFLEPHGLLISNQRTKNEEQFLRLVGHSGQLLWDGFDDAGRALRIGIYVILFEALDTAGGTTLVFKEPVVLARPLD